MEKIRFVRIICFFFIILFLFYSSFTIKSETKKGSDILQAFTQEKILAYKNKNPSPTPTQTPYPTASPTPSPLPTVTPTPVPIPRAIPHGNVIFTISGGNQSGPQVSRGSIDPYDPEYGSTQKIQIYTDKNQSNQSMRVTITTDNRSFIIPMTVTTPNAYYNIWEGAYTVTDSYLFTYKMNIEATSDNGTTIVPIILR